MPLLSYRGDNKYILGDLEELFVVLEDHQVMLQSMLSSKDVTLILDKVDVWQKRLSLFSDTIDEWLSVQRDWMYLENIFSAEDICTQLPKEAVRPKIEKFQNVVKCVHYTIVVIIVEDYFYSFIPLLIVVLL